jgi:hypothetical protein
MKSIAMLPGLAASFWSLIVLPAGKEPVSMMFASS